MHVWYRWWCKLAVYLRFRCHLEEEKWEAVEATNEFVGFFTCWASSWADTGFYILFNSAIYWDDRRPRVFSVYSEVFSVQMFRHDFRIIPSSASPFRTSHSRCSFSSFSTTCFRAPLSTRVLSQPSKTARWREITAITSHIAERLGTSCGVVLWQFSRVPGWPSTLTSLVRGSERRTFGLKDVFGIRFCHSRSIAFLCSSVRCLCPSMC